MVAILNDVSETPDGKAPGVARMLAEYVVDQHLHLLRQTKPGRWPHRARKPGFRFLAGTLSAGVPVRGGGGGGQRASAARTCSGVGAVPPRWAGIHQVSFASLGRTG